MGGEPDPEWSPVREVLARQWGLTVTVLRRVRVGVDTANFQVEVHSGERCFAKVYRRTAVLDEERAALELGRLARDAGVPVPAVIPTLDGSLVAADDIGPSHRGVSVHEWSHGVIQPVLEPAAARAAGAALRRIQDRFATLPASTLDSPLAQRFLATDATALRSRFERLRMHAAQRRDDELAQRSVPLLERRQHHLEALPELLEVARRLPTQVIHGDYSRLNLLFRGSTLDAVVDFRPPSPYFPDYELARIAFDPDTVALTDDWIERGLAVYDGYVADRPPPGRPLPLGPAQWLAQLIRSDYGIKQHLDEPHPTQQAALDRYWLLRCETIERLSSALGDIQQRIRAVTA